MRCRSGRGEVGWDFFKKFFFPYSSTPSSSGWGEEREAQAELQKRKGAAQTAADSGSACERGWRPRLLLSLCCGYKTGTILSHQQPQSVLSWRHRF
jgi:hypothetical protein